MTKDNKDLLLNAQGTQLLQNTYQSVIQMFVIFFYIYTDACLVLSKFE